MNRDGAAALLLVIIVAAAGCTALEGGEDEEEEVRVTPTDGLSVSFQPSKRAFSENEVLRFDVQVQNTGRAEASAVTTDVFGNPFVDNSGDRCDPPLDDQIGDTLSRPIPANNQPGEEYNEEWRCDPAAALDGFDLPDGADDTFTAGMKTEYDYETAAAAQVTVEEAGDIGSKRAVTTDNSAAPVKAKIAMKSPQAIREDGSLRIPVTIRNVGDGEIVDKVEYEISTSSTDTTVTGGTTLIGGSRQIMEEIGGFDAAGSTYDIQIDLSYTYKERTTSEFTVEGVPPGTVTEER